MLNSGVTVNGQIKRISIDIEDAVCPLELELSSADSLHSKGFKPHEHDIGMGYI